MTPTEIALSALFGLSTGLAYFVGWTRGFNAYREIVRRARE